MVWEIIRKEYKYKKCFALFPKKIGDYMVWLSPYYKTWDLLSTWGYVPHWFVHKEDVIKYIEDKKERIC